MIATKLILAPGPLTTSETDTAAMFHDAGSSVADYLEVVRQIRRPLFSFGRDEPNMGRSESKSRRERQLNLSGR
jgi:hypothetical protein